MKAEWSGGSAQLNSTTELDQVMGAIRELGRPTLLFLSATDGKTLVVGIGWEESVLGYMEKGRVSLHSLGDPERKGALSFEGLTEPSEYSLEMAIPEPVALEAAKEFLKTGARPAGVTWEADG